MNLRPTWNQENSCKGDICGCVSRLLETLKQEYRDGLHTVELEERSLGELAGKAEITSNNAAVRAHRARQALRK
jgi:DNA-directed RNA polymerase specialized sigma24 family protein